MSHLALYRKYRPQTFDQVKGQDQTIHYLQTIIQSKNIPHAMIFSGIRGTGKTTLARIFAKEIGVAPYDIYEIDAPSYSGVKNMRDFIAEEVPPLPMGSQYKIYIIDEAHMLSRDAWNAFLKMLEEPPAHVIFIMVTTELHKILDTIKSRSQIINLARPSNQSIREQLIFIAQQEGKILPENIAKILADKAQGAFRDGIVLLEQVLEISESDTITITDLEKIGLRSYDEFVFQFLELLESKNQGEIFQLVKKIGDTHTDAIKMFLEKLIDTTRAMLYIKHAPELWQAETINYSDEEIQKMTQYGNGFIGSANFLRKLLEVYHTVQKSTFSEIPLELAIIEILGNNEDIK